MYKDKNVLNEYQKKYWREKRMRYSLNLSKKMENDIIEAIELEGNCNRQKGIKSLIKKGMRYNDLTRD